MGAPVKASRELARAVEDEAHRAQVDAAKKRAVGQLSDYDTFRNMVSVAHLRPVFGGESYPLFLLGKTQQVHR